MNTQHYFTATKQALLAAVLVMALLVLSFFLFEPNVGQAVVGTPFTIKQTITDEISFLTQANNVVATGTINGMTGGTSNGTTTVVVKTNKPTGYEMSIAFTNNGTDNAMRGDTTLSSSIQDYPAGGQPTYDFSTASSAAVFAYTVSAQSLTDVAQSFLDNGSSACNQSSGSETGDKCWMEPMTTGFKIIDRTTAAITGATSTIMFRVHVPNNPSPGVPADTYTATATLTAINH